MSSNKINRIRRLEVSYIFLSAGLAPILTYFNDFAPSIDGLQKMVSWIPSIKSFIHEGQFPLWIPNVVNGINAAIWNQSLSGVDYLAIFTVVLNLLDLKQAFLFWMFVNNLITYLSLRWIFCYLQIERTWYLGLITMLSICYYSLIQVYFNFLGIAKFSLLIFALYRFILYQDRRRLAELLIFIVCILPFGYLVYSAPFFLYLGILTIWSSRTRLSGIRQKLKIFSTTRVTQPILFLLVISIYTCFTVYQFLISKFDLSIVSPGRDQNGGQSLNSFLNYGGYQGFKKFSNIFGFGLDDILSGSTHLDFWLVVSPISFGLLIVGLQFLNLKSLENTEIRSWLINSVAISLFTLPFIPLASLLFYTLPGIDKLRHLSYFSFLLVPSLYILSALVHKQITESEKQKRLKKRDKSGQKVFKDGKGQGVLKRGSSSKVQPKLAFQIFAVSLLCLIVINEISKKLNENYVSFIPYLFEALSRGNLLAKMGGIHCLSFILILFLLRSMENRDKESKNRSRLKDQSFRMIPMCFVSFGLVTFIAFQSTHVPISKLTNNQIDSLYRFVRDPLPKTRIPPAISERLKLFANDPNIVSGVSGQKIIYDSIAYLTNEDYCVSVGRTDVVSKRLWMHSEIYAQPSLTSSICDLPEEKISIFDSKGNILEASTSFEYLGYNKVKINYKVLNERMSAVYLVYFDAGSNLKLWNAVDSLGKKLQFSEVPNRGNEISRKLNDYKVIKVSHNSGTITLRINSFAILLQNLKSIADVVILLYLLALLIRSQKHTSLQD